MILLLTILLIIFWSLCVYGGIVLYKWQFRDISTGITILMILLGPIGLIAGIINYLIERK